jgi:hypothetical protein
MLESVILIQQPYRGIRDCAELLGGEVVERRQRLYLPGHHPDLSIGHATVRRGHEDHRKNQCLGRIQGVARAHCGTPYLPVAKLIEPSRQFKRAAIRPGRRTSV